MQGIDTQTIADVTQNYAEIKLDYSLSQTHADFTLNYAELNSATFCVCSAFFCADTSVSDSATFCVLSARSAILSETRYALFTLAFAAAPPERA